MKLYIFGMKRTLNVRKVLSEVYNFFIRRGFQTVGLLVATKRVFSQEKKDLEIGGPSPNFFSETGIFPIYPKVANLDGLNFSKKTIWGQNMEGWTYKYHKDKMGYQFICEAVDLANISSEAYDFVLASHVIEHIANPFKAIAEWLRVLKKDGDLLLIVPHRDGTFDHKRPVTSFSHLLEDFANNVKEDDLTHLPEILELHDLKLDPPAGDFDSFKKRSMDNYENRYLHHHVFNTKLVIQIFNYFNIQILSVDLILPYNIIIIGKKKSREEILDNSRFLEKKTKHFRNSPFPSDKD